MSHEFNVKNGLIIGSGNTQPVNHISNNSALTYDSSSILTENAVKLAIDASKQLLLTLAFNDTNSTIVKGSAVKITTANSLPYITLANSSLNNNQVVGLVQNDILSGQTGYIVTQGILSGLNITGFTIDDMIYCSDVIDGGYITSNNLKITSRTNQIGYITQTGVTTGKIFVQIVNEQVNTYLTMKESIVMAGNAGSTGVYEFQGIVRTSNTTFNISPVKGWIVQNTYSNANNPLITYIMYSGVTGATTPYINIADSSHVMINSASTIFYLSTYPTPQQRRENIYLGKIVHTNRQSIISVNNNTDYVLSTMSSLRDMFNSMKLINDGVAVSANDTNMMINLSSGSLFGMGINWFNNQLNPNQVTINASSPASFYYRTQTGGTAGTGTTINPNVYDLNGTITTIPNNGDGGGNRSTNQRVYLYPTGIINIQYGQQVYDTLALALAGQQTEIFIKSPNVAETGILIGIIAVRRTTTNLSNKAYAIFTPASMFGESVGGVNGISTTTLQQAYENSVVPEITTNSTLGSLMIKVGTGIDTDYTYQSRNTADANTFYVMGNGRVGIQNAVLNNEAINLQQFNSGLTNITYIYSSGLTNNSNIITNNLITGKAGGQTIIGGTGTTDMLVIKGTSGNGTLTSTGISFNVGNNGANSAMTILNNGNIGIGTSSPTYKLDISGSTRISNTLYFGGTASSSSDYSHSISNSSVTLIIKPRVDDANAFQIQNSTGTTGFNFSTTDFTQTIGTSNSGGTLNVKSTLGPEMSPTLEAANWTLGADWSAGGGILLKTASGHTTTATPSGAFNVLANRTYKVVINYTSGSSYLNYIIGGQSGTMLNLGTTTITDYITTKTTGKIIFNDVLGTSAISITYLSVKLLDNTNGNETIDGNLTVNSITNFRNPIQLGFNTRIDPQAPLEIYSSYIGAQYEGIRIYRQNTTVQYLSLYSDGSNQYLSNVGIKNFSFINASQHWFFASGNLGVGYSGGQSGVPSFTFSVSGSTQMINNTPLYFGGTYNSASDYTHSIANNSGTLIIKPRVDAYTAITFQNAIGTNNILTIDTINNVMTTTKINGLSLYSNTTGFTFSGGTLSKSLTINNNIILSGTDGSTLNINNGGTLGSNAFTSTAYQPFNTSLNSITALTYTSSSFVKMTGANTFSLDTNNYVNKTGDTITGPLIINSNLNVIGNLIVSGTTFTLNSTNVAIKDNIITINSGETGSGVSQLTAGIKVDRGISTPYYFVFDELSDTFRIGNSTATESYSIVTSGDTQAVATREDIPNDSGITYWDAGSSKFITNSNITIVGNNIVTTGLINGINLSTLGTAAFTSSSTYLYVSNNLSDLSNKQIALNNLTNVTGATNEYILTKDTASSNVTWKPPAIVTDTILSLSNNTSNNVSITKHGFAPILPNNASLFFNGQGNYTIPTGTVNNYLLQAFNNVSATTITHGFGTYPNIQCIDSTGAVFIPISIINNTLNDFTVIFDTVIMSGNVIATVGSPQAQALIIVNGNYTILKTDRVVKVTATNSIITLPNASGSTGREYVIKNLSNGLITVNTINSQLIDNQLTQTLYNGEAITVISDGANYFYY